MLAALWWSFWWLRRVWHGLWVRPSGHLGRGRRVEPSVARCRAHRKPEWAVRQLVLLKAHLPHAGCRLIAVTFNRVFAHRDVSVSKSFVFDVLRRNELAVAQARRAIRQARPRPVAANQCWGVDLTGRADAAGQVHTLLGIVDHGSRLAAMDALLADWRHWYNTLRPHQNLGGMTPQQAWDGVDPFHAPQAPEEVRFVEGWDGLIAGFRIRR